jgi:hypothetical protein
VLIKYQFIGDSIIIEARTNTTEDISALEITFKIAGLNPQKLRTSFFRRDRKFLERYQLEASEVMAMQRTLGGIFSRDRGFFLERSASAGVDGEPSDGSVFACQEAKLAGSGSCIEFTASDDAVARVKCGLIASKENWFGGVSRRGPCR